MAVRLGLVLAVLGGVTAIAATEGPPTAEELATALQTKYAAVKDFSADFVHKYRGGVLHKEATERGTVLIKKPARMRWTYESPEKKIFVSDGVRFYSYIPEDRQVIVSPLPEETDAPTPLLFLSGRGKLARDFVASIPATASPLPNTYSLKCTPRRREADYQSMILVVDRQSLEIRSLITTDEQGGESTFVFSRVKQNIGLADKLFVFDIPRGVDVVHQTPNIR
jgi:outer membrane lipoprotein carrier protein